jgi:hypothetical protein
MTTEHLAAPGAPCSAPLLSIVCTARVRWTEPVTATDTRPFAYWDVSVSADPYVGCRLTLTRTDADDGSTDGVRNLALSRGELEALARALPAVVAELGAMPPAREVAL